MTARSAAADLLVAVLDRGQTLDDALAANPLFNQLTGRDRGFARALVSTTLRRLGGIDRALAAHLARPLPQSALLGRAILRLGAAQILFLGTPPHAAVSETVSQARAERGAAGFANLMNAVLRKVAQNRDAHIAKLAPGDDLPAWLYARWRATYGDTTAAAIANALLEESPLDLSAKKDAQHWAQELNGELTPTNSIRLAEHAPVETLSGFTEGAWWVQDAAAALPVRLLGDVAGQRVLDLCAAPGGKTLQLAAAGARVTALDRDRGRLERLAASLGRTDLDADIVCADARSWKAPKPFDAVLLDAPCSATGTLRRHPDVAWLRRPSDIASLAALQAELLASAANHVRPGGRLVYAVCSLEPEEGPAIAARAAAPLRHDPIGAEELPAPFRTPEGAMRTLPSHWTGGLDGFYAARFIRDPA